MSENGGDAELGWKVLTGFWDELVNAADTAEDQEYWNMIQGERAMDEYMAYVAASAEQELEQNRPVTETAFRNMLRRRKNAW